MPSRLLDSTSLAAGLAALPGWQLCAGRLCRDLRFPSFKAAMAFMASGAELAEALGHHPDWCNSYRDVKVRLWTHDAGGLTAKDLELAAGLSTLTAGMAGTAALAG